MANATTRKPSRTAGKTRNPRRQGPVTQDRKAAHSAQEALPGRQPAPAASATALTTAPAGHDGTAAPVPDETAAAVLAATATPAGDIPAAVTTADTTPVPVAVPAADAPTPAGHDGIAAPVSDETAAAAVIATATPAGDIPAAVTTADTTPVPIAVPAADAPTPAGHDGTAAPVPDETAAAAVIVTGAPAAGTTAVATPAAETPTTVPAPKACVLSATAVGEQHLRSLPPVPCQDAAGVQPLPRPALALADGAGSAAVSHLGAQTLVRGLLRFLASTEDLCAELLDAPALPPAQEQTALTRFADRILAHACGLLRDRAEHDQRKPADLRSTLTLAILGGRRLFWLRVGDSPLVLERNGELHGLGGSGRGEYANLTCFVGADPQELTPEYGLVPMDGVSGVIAFSDGAGDRLMSSTDTPHYAGTLTKMLAGGRDGELTSAMLHGFLHDPNKWKGTRGDDRSLALLACRPTATVTVESTV